MVDVRHLQHNTRYRPKRGNIALLSRGSMPVSEYPRQVRLGMLVRRARLNAEKTLQDVAAALSDDDFDKSMLLSVEAGRLPLSWEQIDAFCDYFKVDPKAFQDALVDFHHAIWEDGEGEGEPVKLVEQNELVAQVPIHYDQVELVLALRNAVSTMDVAQGILAKMNRIVRHLEEHQNDAKMAAQAVELLRASQNYILAMLESTKDLSEVGEHDM